MLPWTDESTRKSVSLWSSDTPVRAMHKAEASLFHSVLNWSVFHSVLNSTAELCTDTRVSSLWQGKFIVPVMTTSPRDFYLHYLGHKFPGLDIFRSSTKDCHLSYFNPWALLFMRTKTVICVIDTFFCCCSYTHFSPQKFWDILIIACRYKNITVSLEKNEWLGKGIRKFK